MMRKHLVAVCMVCLLCADHFHCRVHDVGNQKQKVGDHILEELDGSVESLSLFKNDDAHTNSNVMKFRRKGRPITNDNDKLKGISSDDNEEINLLPVPMGNKRRTKRHAIKIAQTPNIDFNFSEKFVQKLFNEFGDGDRLIMNVDGFEKLLQKIALNLVNSNSINQPLLKENRTDNNQTCVSNIELVERVKHNEYEANHVHPPEENDESSYNGHSSNETLTKQNIFLSKDNLLQLCPIVLYQISRTVTDGNKLNCVDGSMLPTLEDQDSHHHLAGNTDVDHTLVWIYASLSILGASLCGLLGVAVIPCMEKLYYQQIIQFLVSLAVGTLCGDALLHLLPHSMMTMVTLTANHDALVIKGLVAAMGIIFFFIMEKGLNYIAEWRKNYEKRQNPTTRVRVMRDPESVSMNGDKLCKNKYSSYPYCYDEIAMEAKNDIHQHNQKSHNSNDQKLNNYESTEQEPLKIVHPDKENSKELIDNQLTNMNRMSNDIDLDKDLLSDMKNIDEKITVILRAHESKHHGHSHMHGHVHSPPRSMSSVAWMVIMGDGLHNFTDGMAIGAAFANSIAGGFSTAVAVFCHELPHELGDFAVLLKAGMSAKEAVYYNVLSSVLSFFGMALGILIGDTPEASAWIFAAAAGMFIYIALVDMMPELSSSHNEQCAFSQCTSQIIGLLIGVGIMLLIALYEHDLKVMFDPEHSH